MGACVYGIYVRDLELNTRREIPYLQATIKRLESASAIRLKMKKKFWNPSYKNKQWT